MINFKDVFVHATGYDPKELFDTFVIFMKRTDSNLQEINRKLDILVAASKKDDNVTTGI